MAKNVYEALNAQLLDELPKLYRLSFELIHECIARLVRAQKNFYIACVEALYTLPDVSRHIMLSTLHVCYCVKAQCTGTWYLTENLFLNCSFCYSSARRILLRDFFASYFRIERKAAKRWKFAVGFKIYIFILATN